MRVDKTGYNQDIHISYMEALSHNLIKINK